MRAPAARISVEIARRRRGGAGDGEGRGAPRPVERDVDPAIMIALFVDAPLERRQRHAVGCRTDRSLAAASARARSFTSLGETRRRRRAIDEVPLLGPVGAHAFGRGAENIGEIAPHLALVDQAGQAAGARQHAQQRHLGQADGGGAIVDHDDLVAGERQLVAAAGAGAVQRREEFETGTPARIPRCRCGSRW